MKVKVSFILSVLFVALLCEALILAEGVPEEDHKVKQLALTPQPRFFFGKYFNLPAHIWSPPCVADYNCCFFKCITPGNLACAAVTFPVPTANPLYCSATTGGVPTAQGMICKRSKSCNGKCENPPMGYSCGGAGVRDCDAIVEVGAICKQPPPPY